MTMQSGVVFTDGARLWVDTAIRDAALPGWPVVQHASKGLVSLPNESGFHYAAVFSGLGFRPEALAEIIGHAYATGLADLTRACQRALRKTTDNGRLIGSMLVAAWENGPHMFLMVSNDVPGVAPAFEPIGRVSWFQPLPENCPAYIKGSKIGFDPQLATEVVLASIETPYDAFLEDKPGRWVAGNIIELTVTAAGATASVIREGVPNQMPSPVLSVLAEAA